MISSSFSVVTAVRQGDPCSGAQHCIHMQLLFVGFEFGVGVSIHSLPFPEHPFPGHRHTCRKRLYFNKDTDTDTDTRIQHLALSFPAILPVLPLNLAQTTQHPHIHPLLLCPLSWTRTHTPFCLAGRQISAVPTVLEADLQGQGKYRGQRPHADDITLHCLPCAVMVVLVIKNSSLDRESLLVSPQAVLCERETDRQTDTDTRRQTHRERGDKRVWHTLAHRNAHRQTVSVRQLGMTKTSSKFSHAADGSLKIGMRPAPGYYIMCVRTCTCGYRRKTLATPFRARCLMGCNPIASASCNCFLPTHN